MSQEEYKVFAKLFGNVDILSEEHLELILQNMNKEQSLFFLVEAIKLGYKQNLYTIGEVEVISKAIRVMNRN